MKGQIRSFEVASSREFLVNLVGNNTRRSGLKTKLAGLMRCQPAYLSQILAGKANMTIEQCERLCDFLSLPELEEEYLLLMVLKERAGSRELRQKWQVKMDHLLSRSKLLSENLGKSQMTPEAIQYKFYSTWKYSALHIALTIPRMRNEFELSREFNINLKEVRRLLDDLIEMGLVSRAEDGELVPVHNSTRLGSDSPLRALYHSNWRDLTIDVLQANSGAGLHYSAVVSLSKSLAKEIKDRVAEEIRKNIEDIRSDKEEVLYVYCADFFELRRSRES